MELSKGFLLAASKRAKKLGVKFTTLHESCNRLVYRDDDYDVITVAQALHWLDDVLVCRGVCRLLQPNGSFFVIHSGIDLDESHPLAYVLGHDSILGKKQRQNFAAEVQPIFRRLTLLFDALDMPEVQRIDPAQRWTEGSDQKITPAGASFFHQRRPFDAGYARGFLTHQHIEATGQTPAEFWNDLEACCASATPEQLLGSHHWAVMQFKRGGVRVGPDSLASCIVKDIGFQVGAIV
jgi:SAM-dependent methyltransferase